MQSCNLDFSLVAITNGLFQIGICCLFEGRYKNYPRILYEILFIRQLLT
jgi:hypothetical protein